MTAPDASYARAIEDLEKFEISDLITDIKRKILERSSFGIRGIARIFKAMDDNGNRNLDVDDFRWGLIDFGISVSKEEAAEILVHFDKDKNGSVNFDEFLRAVKGDTLNEKRAALVKQAYEKLDVNSDQSVRLDDIAQLYDAS